MLRNQMPFVQRPEDTSDADTNSYFLLSKRNASENKSIATTVHVIQHSVLVLWILRPKQQERYGRERDEKDMKS